MIGGSGGVETGEVPRGDLGAEGGRWAGVKRRGSCMTAMHASFYRMEICCPFGLAAEDLLGVSALNLPLPFVA